MLLLKSRLKEPTYRRHGFTLLELIVVMALLSTVFAVAAPQLRLFMSGRDIEEECRRFLALTRYARTQAIGRGQKMTLWVSPSQGQYGLRPESSSLDQGQPVSYSVARNLSISAPDAAEDENKEITILFWPDGTIDEQAPQQFTINENDQAQYAIILSDNRLQYEVKEVSEMKETSDVQP